jgi:hypothetical protein
VPGQDGVDDLRDNRVAIADNTGKKFVAALQFTDQVLAQLVFDSTLADSLVRKRRLF